MTPVPPLSRRQFLQQAALASGALAASAGLPSVASASTPAPATAGSVDSFPPGFIWGAATSSYQIEGATAEDGRTPSIWDTFAKTPGKTLNGDTGDVACNHYHLYRDDVALMADLGVKHYRFSISWSRVLPQGRGAVNERGVDFYKRLLDALQEKGIEPCVTLFHWDLPQVLQDEYLGWQSRRVVDDFTAYADLMGKRLGDRVPRWFTTNEISSFIGLAYGLGQPGFHAPGIALPNIEALARTNVNALLAHGRGAQALRSHARAGAQIGLAENFRAYIPITETPEHIAAAQRAFEKEIPNAAIIIPILTGKLDPQSVGLPADIAPLATDAELRDISTPIDILGFNCYQGDYARAADNAKGYDVVPFPAGYPRMVLNWLTVTPEAPYWGTRQVSELLGKRAPAIVMSENGCPDAAPAGPDGAVTDVDRIMYLRAYLRSVQRAAREGYPMVGYFPWSLMDNFEWAEGYTQRFGLVHVNYATQKRTPKASYRWFQEVIRQNRVV